MSEYLVRFVSFKEEQCSGIRMTILLIWLHIFLKCVTLVTINSISGILDEDEFRFEAFRVHTSFYVGVFGYQIFPSSCKSGNRRELG
jgi:hypothetical protein